MCETVIKHTKYMACCFNVYPKCMIYHSSSLKFVFLFMIVLKIYQALSLSMQNKNLRQQFKLEISLFNPNQFVFLHDFNRHCICTVSRIYLNVTLFQRAASILVYLCFFLKVKRIARKHGSDIVFE